LEKGNLKVDILSDGDGFKSFKRTIDIKGFTSNKVIYTITRVFREIYAVLLLPKYDVIQIINPLVFSRFGPSKLLMYLLRKKAKKMVLLAVGDDYFYWKAYRDGKFMYSPHKDVMKLDKNIITDVWETKRLKELNEYLITKVDAIVPGMPDYEIGYKNHPKLYPLINYPINLSKIEFKANKCLPTDKIKIFQGVQRGREGFKGTNYVDQAMQVILQKYPDEVEYFRPVSIPFEQYIAMLTKANVLIDQVNSYGSGMNGLFGLAMGKIVLGGNEPVNCENYNDSPIFNIKPDVEQIIETIEKVIKMKDSFELMAIKNREYIENHHSHYKIANDFLELYNKL